MKHILKAVRIITILLLSQSILGQTSTLDKETIEKLDSVFYAYHQNDDRGSIMSIIENGQTVYSNEKGLANLEHQIPINNTTTFNIASNSKQFTMFLALLLEEEGKLSLDDDIRIHLPELNHLPKKITVKQLANHTHGLPNPDELARLKGIKTMHHKQVLEMLLNIKQVNFEAGDELIYNNTGFVLLSEIIERVGKKPFVEQLQEKIFKPLEMNNTQAIGYADDVIKNKAYSYKKLGDTYITFPVELATMGSSGIYTTINDLGLWAKNYQNTILGKPKFYKKMQEITFLDSGKQTNYGLGLQVDNYKGIDVVFHGGGTESYRSYILHVPSHKVSLLFLSNKRDLFGLDIMYKSLEILLKKFVQEEETFKILSSKELKKLEGTYEMFPGIYYNIIAENDKLYFQDFGSTDKFRIPQIGEYEFDYPFPHFKLTFYKNGFNYHMADMTYPCKKVTLQTPKTKDIDLTNFVGTYKNTVLNVSYELFIKEGKLIAKNYTNSEITLLPIAKNSFYTNQAFFAKVDFIMNDSGTIESLKVSGQNLKNIIFKKII